VDSSVPEQRILEQSARLPPDGAVTGWASLRLAGATYFDGVRPDGSTLRPVPLAVGRRPSFRDTSGAEASREPLADDEVVMRQGMRSTSVWRALFDELRALEDLRDVVVAIEMAAAAELASISQMSSYVREHSSWRRSGRLPEALELAGEESRSPAETKLRLLWRLDAGLPEPLVNRPLLDLRDRQVCVPDLLDVEAGMVVEYDGAEHRTAARHTRDVRREDACRRLGLEYVAVTGIDMRERDRVVDRLLVARRRARFEPVEQRAWHPGPAPESLDRRLVTRAWLLAQQAFERGTPLG
jgi:hypothetical protein